MIDYKNHEDKVSQNLSIKRHFVFINKLSCDQQNGTKSIFKIIAIREAKEVPNTYLPEFVFIDITNGF